MTRLFLHLIQILASKSSFFKPFFFAIDFHPISAAILYILLGIPIETKISSSPWPFTN